mmetsp:Transcript_33217/g.48770  ORF Transcript_33217/g.48770 Transcript_33217/m.48770 type:complete len:302 (-) Transcript_33217:199-1104(-)
MTTASAVVKMPELGKAASMASTRSLKLFCCCSMIAWKSPAAKGFDGASASSSWDSSNESITLTGVNTSPSNGADKDGFSTPRGSSLEYPSSTVRVICDSTRLDQPLRALACSRTSSTSALRRGVWQVAGSERSMSKLTRPDPSLLSAFSSQVISTSMASNDRFTSSGLDGSLVRVMMVCDAVRDNSGKVLPVPPVPTNAENAHDTVYSQKCSVMVVTDLYVVLPNMPSFSCRVADSSSRVLVSLNRHAVKQLYRKVTVFLPRAACSSAMTSGVKATPFASVLSCTVSAARVASSTIANLSS